MSESIPKYPILVLLIGLAVAPGPALAAESAPAIDWPERFYNPAPAPEDMVLPLACGGALVFRPVEIPADDPLDDRPVELGQSDPERGYKEGRRQSHLAGSFSESGRGVRRYYIAKYETSRDQYAALAGAACPKPSMQGRLPATELSWFDAVDYSRRYTEWLLAKAPGALPKEGQEPGFVRLPTEEEWELAARGGLKVDEADFLAPVFPMPEGDLARYAWFESTQSAAGALHPTGLLKPNPLGLHDILGNAAEMTLVPFHLDHRGRPHGQAGGFVSRGGDYLTPESQLGSAVRQEHTYFNAGTGRAKTLDSLGFRLVLTAPVIVSQERLDAIKQAWSGLPTLGGEAGKDAGQALDELKDLAARSQDEGLRGRLELIQRDMERSQSAIAEAQSRTLGALLRMGAFLGKRVVTDEQRVRALEQLMGLAQTRFDSLIKGIEGKPKADAVIAEARANLKEKLTKWQTQLDEIRSSGASGLSYYGDMVVGVGRDFGEAQIQSALKLVEEELKLKQNAYLIPYASAFAAHLSAYRRDGQADKARWLKDLPRGALVPAGTGEP